MTEQLIQTKLSKESFRLTKQRQAVLEVMQENQGRHLNAEEVLAEAREKEPNLGIATVYRTLDKLSSLGILYKSAFDEGKNRYELAGDEEHHHHHIVCVICAKITEFEEDLLYNLECNIEEQGYKVIDHQLIIYAYCPDCKAKQGNY